MPAEVRSTTKPAAEVRSTPAGRPAQSIPRGSPHYLRVPMRADGAARCLKQETVGPAARVSVGAASRIDCGERAHR